MKNEKRTESPITGKTLFSTSPCLFCNRCKILGLSVGCQKSLHRYLLSKYINIRNMNTNININQNIYI